MEPGILRRRLISSTHFPSGPDRTSSRKNFETVFLSQSRKLFKPPLHSDISSIIESYRKQEEHQWVTGRESQSNVGRNRAAFRTTELEYTHARELT